MQLYLLSTFLRLRNINHLSRLSGYNLIFSIQLYDPSLGRFLSTDPLIGHPGSTQSINPYSYVANNPLNAIDPTGEDQTGICATTACPATTAGVGTHEGPREAQDAINGAVSNGTISQATGNQLSKIFAGGANTSNGLGNAISFAKTMASDTRMLAQTASELANVGSPNANFNFNSHSQSSGSSGAGSPGATSGDLIPGYETPDQARNWINHNSTILKAIDNDQWPGRVSVQLGAEANAAGDAVNNWSLTNQQLSQVSIDNGWAKFGTVGGVAGAAVGVALFAPEILGAATDLGATGVNTVRIGGNYVGEHAPQICRVLVACGEMLQPNGLNTAVRVDPWMEGTVKEQALQAEEAAMRAQRTLDALKTEQPLNRP